MERVAATASTEQLRTNDETEQFLAVFFARPNVELAQVLAAKGERANSVRAWIQLLRSVPGTAVLLPCIRGDERLWYGLAFNEPQLRVLSQDVLAFVGPSFSTFRGSFGTFDPADPIDQAVLNYTGGHSLKFSVPAQEPALSNAREALDLMRDVARRRPPDRTQVPRPVGRVLRDFYMSLRAGDRDAAERHLRYLAGPAPGESRIGPLNLLFLRVQALAELGQWEELLSLPDLRELLAMRRPVAVSHALLRAVYQMHVFPYQTRNDASGAVERFRDVIYPPYSGLFSTRAGLQSHEAVLLFMLFSVAGPVPNPALRTELLNITIADQAINRFRADIATRIPLGASKSLPAPADMSDMALASLRGEYDRAFALAVNAAPSVESARVILDSAYEISSLEAAEWAALSIRALPKSEREIVLSNRHRKASYEWALELVSPSQSGALLEASNRRIGSGRNIVAGWFEWLHEVAAEPNWKKAQQVAREGAVQWTIDEFLREPEGVASFADRLTAAGGIEPVRLALPHLLEFFQNDPQWPRAELAPVYRAMADVLVYSTSGGREDFTVLHQLIQALLGLGATAPEYRQILEWIKDLLDGHSAPMHLDWMLDIVDLLIISPCLAPENRVSLLTVIAGQFQKHRRHITRDRAELFRTFSDELGQPELAKSVFLLVGGLEVQDKETPDPLQALGNQSVGVYTLTEGAARRFAEILHRRVPTAVIALNSDHVGSDRLKEMSRNADILIVATASATHAATDVIEKNRPRGRPLLRPSGKGTASMLRVLIEHLESSVA